jgi:mRNA interferase MazF
MSQVPQQFTIYWCNLEPTFGHQMKKTRPCAVISPDEMNELLATVIIVPLTSTVRKLPFYLQVRYDNRNGALACDQIKAIDKRRVGKSLGQMTTKDKNTLSTMLRTMFQVSQT